MAVLNGKSDEKLKERLSCKALLLDLSGVIYQGSAVIPGAAEAVEQARKLGLTLRFVTNTASKSTAIIITQLAEMDITIGHSELFTAPMAAKAYIDQHRLRPYCLLPPAVADLFVHYGEHTANAVLLGDARDGLNYHSLNQAFRLCNQGAPLIAIGMNRYFMGDDGLQLDAGPFVRALEWAAETRAVVLGKPSAEFFQQAVASTGFEPSECMMVGDDWQADVVAALSAGLQAVQVKTGKFQPSDLEKIPPQVPVITSIAELLKSIAD
ncbi:TIGR01458 family HAD-type hydrolase [Amphritea sp. HPY]|uniref:TIGR01458 family HAD-type hydrolase n=1 Tax=Amphritea sp. HPY TaxID=3421652 RepID=UPI003D7C6996